MGDGRPSVYAELRARELGPLEGTRSVQRRQCSNFYPYAVLKSWIAIALLLIFSPAYAETNSEPGIEILSTELRSLLQKEMIAIDAAMKQIVSLNAAGDTQKISKLAKQMKESFILKQSLTQNQRHELHTALPVDFIRQDEKFHYYAGMLEHVSENKKSELIPFYYAKLFEACASCHQTYAKHRFSHFGDIVKEMDHEH